MDGIRGRSVKAIMPSAVCIYTPSEHFQVYWKSVTESPVDLVVANTTRNDLFVPVLGKLMGRRGRALIVTEDEHFVQKYLGKQYEVDRS